MPITTPFNVLSGGGSSLPSGATTAVGSNGTSTDNAVVRWDGTNGTIIQNSTIFIDDSGQLGVGTGNSVGLISMLQVVDTSTASPRGITGDQYNTGTNSAQLNLRKARGTYASPVIIVTGDVLSRLIFWGYDGASFIESGNIRCMSAGTIGTSRVPSQLEFWTSTDANPSVLTKALTLDVTQGATLVGNMVVSGGGLTLSGTSTIIGGAGNMTITAGTGNSRTLTLQTTTSGSVPTTALSIDNAQNMTGVGYLAGCKVRVRVTTQAGSPLTISATGDNRNLFDNSGSTGGVTYNLPTAAANLQYEWTVSDADGITIVASSGDTIRIAGSVSAAAGNIASTTVGSTVRLVAINATEWFATAVNGTWVVT